MTPRQCTVPRCDAVVWRIADEVQVTGAAEFVHASEGDSVEHIRAENLALSQTLSRFLYLHYYLQMPDAALRADRAEALSLLPISAREDPALGAALRAANRGAGYAEPGWRVSGFDGGAVIVRKGPVSLVVRDQPDVDAAAARLGDEITLRFPNDRPYTYPNYYMAVGDGGPASSALVSMSKHGAGVVRFYFNVSVEGAPVLLEALTGTLGGTLRRFSVKVLNHPKAYPRPDAAVAYVRRDEYARACSLLRSIVPAFQRHLGERIPAFVCRFDRGIGVAEEPRSNEPIRPSFGEHRCFMIARGLVNAFCSGVQNQSTARAANAGQVANGANAATDRLRFILAELDAAGIDTSRPYLNRGSLDLFAAETRV